MFVDIWDEIAGGLHAVFEWAIGLQLGGKMLKFFRRILGLPAKQVGGDGSEDFDVRLKRAEIAEAEKKVRENAARVEHYLGIGSSADLARYFKKEMDEAAARLERRKKELEEMLRGR